MDPQCRCSEARRLEKSWGHGAKRALAGQDDSETSKDRITQDRKKVRTVEREGSCKGGVQRLDFQLRSEDAVCLHSGLEDLWSLSAQNSKLSNKLLSHAFQALPRGPRF
jgi:hypothetical protein